MYTASLIPNISIAPRDITEKNTILSDKLSFISNDASSLLFICVTSFNRKSILCSSLLIYFNIILITYIQIYWFQIALFSN